MHSALLPKQDPERSEGPEQIERLLAIAEKTIKYRGTQNFIRRVYKKILAKAGIREMRLHDIRHTYASILLSRGESPVYVKEQMGHSSIQMTVDIYGHLIPSSNRGAVNQFDSPKPSATYTQPAKIEKL